MKKRIYLFSIGAIILCIYMLLSFLPQIKMYSHAYKCKRELYKVKSKIDITDNTFKGLELLESDIDNNYIFLAGEAHGSIKSIDMNLYLLKYFIEKGDIKYILYESGYADSQYLNRYLDTGDESILEYLFEKSSGTMSYTMENYNLLKSIYEYNLTLEKDKKIMFVGIDKENPEVAIKYIKTLLPGKETNNTKVKQFNNIVYWLTKNNYVDESKKALELIRTSQKDIEEYWGVDYFHIKYLLNNLSESVGQLFREELLINNFKKLYEYLPKGKYFGQFGGAHTNLNPVTKSLATYLQNEYEYTKDKVVSIDYKYNDSYSYIPTGLNVDSKLEEYIDPIFFPRYRSTILIKLNYENSIYYEKDIYLNQNNPEIKCYQYMILFSDSKAANHYHKK